MSRRTLLRVAAVITIIIVGNIVYTPGRDTTPGFQAGSDAALSARCQRTGATAIYEGYGEWWTMRIVCD